MTLNFIYTTMDNNLLKRLIADNKRLILPEFGAFLKKETESGTTVIFSPFLRKDDGVMIAEIRREFGIDTADAEAMVEEFMLHIKQSINANGKYIVDGIGVLVKDDNGIISLDTTVAVAEPAPAPQPVAAPTFQNTILQQPVAEAQPAPAPISVPEPVAMPTPAPQPMAAPDVEPQMPTMPPAPQPRQQASASTVNTLYQQQRPQSQRFTGYGNQAAKPQQMQQPQQTPPPTGYQNPAYRQFQQPTTPPPIQQMPQQQGYQNAAPAGGYGNQYPEASQKAKSKKPDMILVIMIAAALIAIAVMVYAYVMEEGMTLDVPSVPATEQAAPAPAAAPLE